MPKSTSSASEGAAAAAPAAGGSAIYTGGPQPAAAAAGREGGSTTYGSRPTSATRGAAAGAGAGAGAVAGKAGPPPLVASAALASPSSSFYASAAGLASFSLSSTAPAPASSANSSSFYRSKPAASAPAPFLGTLATDAHMTASRRRMVARHLMHGGGGDEPAYEAERNAALMRQGSMQHVQGTAARFHASEAVALKHRLESHPARETGAAEVGPDGSPTGLPALAPYTYATTRSGRLCDAGAGCDPCSEGGSKSDLDPLGVGVSHMVQHFKAMSGTFLVAGVVSLPLYILYYASGFYQDAFGGWDTIQGPLVARFSMGNLGYDGGRTAAERTRIPAEYLPWAIAVLDCLATAVVLAGVLWMRRAEMEAAEVYQLTHITAAVFSLRVEGLPADATTEELRDFVETRVIGDGKKSGGGGGAAGAAEAARQEALKKRKEKSGARRFRLHEAVVARDCSAALALAQERERLVSRVEEVEAQLAAAYAEAGLKLHVEPVLPQTRLVADRATFAAAVAAQVAADGGGDYSSGDEETGRGKRRAAASGLPQRRPQQQQTTGMAAGGAQAGGRGDGAPTPASAPAPGSRAVTPVPGSRATTPAPPVSEAVASSFTGLDEGADDPPELAGPHGHTPPAAPSSSAPQQQIVLNRQVSFTEDSVGSVADETKRADLSRLWLERRRLLARARAFQRRILLRSAEAPAVSAYLTFESRKASTAALLRMHRGWCSVLTCGRYNPGVPLFRGRHVLSFIPAPRPSDVLHENLGVGWVQRYMLMALTEAVALGLLAVSLALLFLSRELVARASDAEVAAAFVPWGVGIINIGLNLAVRELTKRVEKHHSLDEQETSIFLRLFLRQTLNSAVFVVLVNSKFTDVSRGDLSGGAAQALGPQGVRGPPSANVEGRFRDLEPLWYGDVGTTLLSVQVLNIVVPHIIKSLRAFSQWAKIRAWRAGALHIRTQRQLNALFEGPVLVLSEKYAPMLAAAYCVLIFSTGMPLLFLVGAVIFGVAAQVETAAALSFYRTSPMYGLSIARAVNRLLVIGVVLKLLFGLWALTTPALPRSSAVGENSFLWKGAQTLEPPKGPDAILHRLVRDYTLPHLLLLALVLGLIALSGVRAAGARLLSCLRCEQRGMTLRKALSSRVAPAAAAWEASGSSGSSASYGIDEAERKGAENDEDEIGVGRAGLAGRGFDKGDPYNARRRGGAGEERSSSSGSGGSGGRAARAVDEGARLALILSSFSDALEAGFIADYPSYDPVANPFYQAAFAVEMGGRDASGSAPSSSKKNSAAGGSAALEAGGVLSIEQLAVALAESGVTAAAMDAELAGAEACASLGGLLRMRVRRAARRAAKRLGLRHFPGARCLSSWLAWCGGATDLRATPQGRTQGAASPGKGGKAKKKAGGARGAAAGGAAATRGGDGGGGDDDDDDDEDVDDEADDNEERGEHWRAEQEAHYARSMKSKEAAGTGAARKIGSTTAAAAAAERAAAGANKKPALGGFSRASRNAGPGGAAAARVINMGDS